MDKTVEQPVDKTMEHLVDTMMKQPADKVEMETHHHHQIHRHQIMEDLEEDVCRDDKGELKNWNSPNQLK